MKIPEQLTDAQAISACFSVDHSFGMDYNATALWGSRVVTLMGCGRIELPNAESGGEQSERN